MSGAPIHAAERRIVRRLRAEGAVSPGAAEPLEGLWGLQRRRLPRMIARGIVREASPGRYYLDEDAWDAYRSQQVRIALVLAGVLLLVGLVVFALTGRVGADSVRWDVVRPEVAKGTVTQVTLDDTQARRARKAWVYTPSSYEAASDVKHHLLILFDGADYTADIPAPTILDNLHAARAIPPTVAVMLDTADGRIADLANHQVFADFVANDLVPWAQARYRIDRSPSSTIVAGYSAGGLAAAYVAFRHPDAFGNVLSQSGAFWRGNEGASSPVEWLTAQFRSTPRLPLRFYIEVGGNETGTTAGGPVFIETNRRLRDALEQKGYPLQYVEVPGAVHNPAHWRTQLGDGLIFLSH